MLSFYVLIIFIYHSFILFLILYIKLTWISSLLSLLFLFYLFLKCNVNIQTTKNEIREKMNKNDEKEGHERKKWN